MTEQSSTTGHVRRVPASELHRFMMQPNIQQQLKQQLFIEACMPRAIMSEKQIGDLISHPPSGEFSYQEIACVRIIYRPGSRSCFSITPQINMDWSDKRSADIFVIVFIGTLILGIDPVVWEQAKRDNPDPKTLIPVPMIGFSELRNRLRLQDEMSKQHQSRLDVSKHFHTTQSYTIKQYDVIQILSKKLHDMQQEQVSLQSKSDKYKRKLLELSHRLLQVRSSIFHCDILRPR